MKLYVVLFLVGVAAVTFCQAQNKPPPRPPQLPIVNPKPAPMPVPRPPPIKPAPMPMPIIPGHPKPPPKWRIRRSPDDQDNKSPGGYRVDIYEQDKVGVVGKVQGHGNVWRSDDGRSRVDAHGEWSKVLDGPQRGKPTHNAGVSFSHDFGR